MKGLAIVGVAVALLAALLLPAVASASGTALEYNYGVPQDSHKVRNKWDLSGTFVAYPGYNWGGQAEGATWTYGFHIKEAMNGNYSVGSIHFVTGDIEVWGSVKATATDYGYWSGDNLAAVGTADYDGQTYYFMFLYAERAVWFAISQTPYDSCWESGTVWGSGLRAYQLHSLNNVYDFPLDEYKAIHS